MAVPAQQTEPPFWRHNAAERMLILSSYHLSGSTAEAYLAALAQYRPAIIQAYPSSIGFLAQYLKEANRSFDGEAPKAIVTSSETLAPDIRDLIEQRFGCRVFDWYGQFERVAAIGTCEHGRMHVLDDYSFVEFLPTDDAGLFEIVGTGFNNHAMPLIRYCTGDLVELDAEIDRSCACGRPFRTVRRVVGRNDDILKLPDGRSIGRLDHIFKGVDGMLDAQIRQDARDRVDIHVVPSPAWTPATKVTIERNARERLGSQVAVHVETVDSIERTGNGKYRRVVCNV
jgi:phenylacetate-CoA ligase